MGVVGGEFFEEDGGVLLWDEEARRADVEYGTEWEKRGVMGGEDLVGSRVNGVGGWGEEDEVVEGGCEVRQDGAEIARIGLDGEDDGQGFGGPGGDLRGVGQGEFGVPGLASKCVGDGMAESWNVDAEGGDVLEAERQVWAGRGPAGAFADGAGFVVAEDDLVEAAAVAGAVDGGRGLGKFFEAEFLECVVIRGKDFLPDRNACG